MTEITAKFELSGIHKLLNVVSGLDVLLDKFMGRFATEAYRRFIFNKVPKAIARKRGGRSHRSGGQLRQSFKAVHRGFLAWEIYSPLADEASGQTPYGFWQEKGETPQGSRVFRQYSTPGTGKEFVEGALLKTQYLFLESVETLTKKALATV